MMGGVICPPLEAAASTAPAKCALNPRFLINGIVMTPVPTTLATALPEIVPNNPLAMVAAAAGPERTRPVAASASFTSTRSIVISVLTDYGPFKKTTIEEQE